MATKPASPSLASPVLICTEPDAPDATPPVARSSSPLEEADDGVSTDNEPLRAAELAALQDHVARLETQAARREAQWRGVCDDIKRMTVAEAAVAERRWKLRLEAKNQELERFKGELDAMLVAAEQLQDQLGAQGHIAVGAVAAAAAAQRAQ